MDGFIKVVALADLPPGRVKSYRVEGEDVAVYNVAGAVYATRDSCTHQSYPLSKGELRGKIIKCDLHQWRYDVTNGEYLDNPTVHVRCYETKIENGDIYVRVSPPKGLP